MKYLLNFILFCAIIFNSSIAQIPDTTIESYKGGLTRVDTFLLDIPKIEKQDIVDNYIGPLITFEKDLLDLAQQSFILNNENRIKRFYLKVPQAYKINFYFKTINWEKINTIHFLSPNENFTLGAFHSNFPVKNTSFMPGNFVVIEVDYKAHKEAELKLESVGVQLKNSGDCMVDVNCEEGIEWFKEKQGVSRLIISSGNQLLSCTGSLVNNTLQNRSPYLLTAFHCLQNSDEDDIDNIVVDFNYENTSCDGDQNLNYESLVGATLLASSPVENGSDFALLELNDTVPQSFNPYFNGWNNGASISASGVVIHHPRSDVKKISSFSSTPSNITVNNGISNAFWKVNWDQTQNGHGVTEQGSSGSPLFNSSKQIVGVLSAGNASCNNLNGFDAFGKFNFHWDQSGNDENSRLMDWLDPTLTGVKSINGLGLGEFTEPDTINTGGDFQVNVLLAPESGNYSVTQNSIDIEIINDRLQEYNIFIIELGSGKIVYQSKTEVELYQFLNLNINTKISQGIYILNIYNNIHQFRKKLFFNIR